jgi:hypothetical protein|tara:strand:- start:106 stop:366 length:261 start_codon:yes stop_codon:yes gene_type:complete
MRRITKQQLKEIIKEEINSLLNEGMTKEDEEFLEKNDFSDPPMGLTPAQEKAYVDALRENPENHDDIYDRFQDHAYANEREWESEQ